MRGDKTGRGWPWSTRGRECWWAGVRGRAGVSLVVVGLSVSLNGSAWATGGDLDTRFSGDGKDTTDFADAFEEANAVAIQRDSLNPRVSIT
jgi:hypothetical protein